MIEVIYQDEQLAVVNKPHGLLMHLSSIALDVEENLKDLLELQFDKKIYLVHRLDRKTAGLVIIAFDLESAQHLGNQFAERLIQKTYWAICRGQLTENKIVTKSLENENGNLQDAETHFIPLRSTELNISTGKYPTTRLTLIECYPKTGRMHQIRRHLAHLRHYIINDKPHGDCKVNKVFKDQLLFNNMMLHAKKIHFKHPKTNVEIELEAPLFDEFQRLLSIF